MTVRRPREAMQYGWADIDRAIRRARSPVTRALLRELRWYRTVPEFRTSVRELAAREVVIRAVARAKRTYLRDVPETRFTMRDSFFETIWPVVYDVFLRDRAAPRAAKPSNQRRPRR